MPDAIFSTFSEATFSSCPSRLPFETRQELETNWLSPILTHAALVYSFGSIGCTSLSAPLASDSSLRVSDFLEEKSESGNSNCLSKPLTINCLPKVIVLTNM